MAATPDSLSKRLEQVPDDPGFGTGVTGTGPSPSLIREDIIEAQKELALDDALIRGVPDTLTSVPSLAEELITKTTGDRATSEFVEEEGEDAPTSDMERGVGKMTPTLANLQATAPNMLEDLLQRAGKSVTGAADKALGGLTNILRNLEIRGTGDPIIDHPYGSRGIDITEPSFGLGRHSQYDPSIYEDESGIVFDPWSQYNPNIYEHETGITVEDNPFVEGQDLGGGGDYYDDWGGAVEDDDSQIWATGGPVRFATGGGLESVADQYLEPGSYVLSADVMSGLGDGSSEAGFERLSGLLGIPMPGTETSVNAYSGGPMLGKIEGPGTGTSDSVHTIIQSSDGKSGQQAARVAREEGVLTPEALKEMDRRFGTGKGDLGNAHNMMNNMMANVRKVKSGGSQPKDIIGQRQDPLKGLLGLFQKA